ncbi:MAG: DEAD/DEAH box helicase [Bacteroidota bacterium]
MDTFEELGLSSELLNGLKDVGFETPTEIQKSAIGQLLENERDLMGLAQTGTGKTAAFALPLLDLMDDGADFTQAVILAPTRELVQQIAVEVRNFSKYKRKIYISTVYGGAPISNQIKEIKRNTPHIIIATPGRLIDLIGRKVVNLTDINYLILDEADEMLNMGFQEEIDKILEGTNEGKKTWLFSATMPKEIKHIVDTYMDDPIEVKVDQQNITNQNISHKYVLVNRKDKAEAVKRVIDYIPELYGVIFCRTKMDTQELADELARDGYRAEAIHGDLSQAQRDKVMRKFRSGAINIMVATDVAARGIDVNNLTHVIHYTLPDSPAYYTHRSGRTARAGKKGVSLTILIPKDKGKMRQIAKRLKIDFEKVLLPKHAELLEKRIEKWTEKLMASDEAELPKETLENVLHQLSDLDKETLVAKLIAQQLKKIRKKKSSQDDLNLEEYGRGERSERKGRRSDRKREYKSEGRRERDRRRDKERSGRRERERKVDSKEGRIGRRSIKNGYTKMYINIGKMDKMSVGELVDFISKNGNVKRKLIGDIKMSKMHSVFELDRSVSKSISKYFANVNFKGRDIRCNED